MQQEQSPATNTKGTVLVGPFSSVERDKLIKKRDEILEKAEYLKRVTDTNRRRFVAFLMEMGDISDDEA